MFGVAGPREYDDKFVKRTHCMFETQLEEGEKPYTLAHTSAYLNKYFTIFLLTLLMEYHKS